MTSIITFLAFLIDWLIGDPQKWPHPVRLIGHYITFWEKRFRTSFGAQEEDEHKLRRRGMWLALIVVVTTMSVVGLMLFLSSLLGQVVWFIICLYLVYSAVCLKDLYFQSMRVERALERGELLEARQRLAWIVGRDTNDLSAEDMRRAVIETLAENFSDGLVAPLFYLALGGPILAWGYKAINTLDSMVGYKNEKFLHLGRFSAKLDDVANYLPSRLAAFIILVSAKLLGYDFKLGLKIWRRDRRLHSSPNSGHPEAAMAGAIHVRLGGPGYYGGALVEKPYINVDGESSTAETLKAAEQIMISSAILMLVLTSLVILIIPGDFGWFR